jgi:CO/xanthine dehydrogenase Mo-binding subunit
VVTAQDSPKVPYGLHVLDETVFSIDKVRYIGDEIAAVAATDPYTAEEALKKIDVDYEELPAVFDPQEAMADGAPVIHQSFRDNIVHAIDFSYGDIESALAKSSIVLEKTFTTSRQWQAPIEPFSCIAWWTSANGLSIWAPVQDPYTTMQSVATVFNLPEAKVRVIQTPIGASFGSKLFHRKTTYISVLLSLFSLAPVRMTNTVYEEIAAGRPRVPTKIRQRLGVAGDGRVIAKETDILADNGAYTGYAVGVFTVMSTRSEALYNIPNVKTSGKLVYTNTVPSGSFRGFGNIASMFALESMMDEAAREFGMDGIDFRLKNCVRQGDVTYRNWRINSCGLPECLEAVRKRTNAWKCETNPQLHKNRRRGIGVAIGLHVSGNRTRPFDGSTATVRLNEDGSVMVISGDGDQGQGLDAVFALIVSETLGIDVDRIQIAQVDTQFSPPCLGIFADRGTTISAKAVQLATEKLVGEILNAAGDMVKLSPQNIRLKQGYIFDKQNKQLFSLSDVARHAFWRFNGQPLQGVAIFDPETTQLNPDNGYCGNPSTGYTFTALGIEVEVNQDTGEVKILRAVSAHDLGKLINPLLAEGQVKGAFAQGMGFATSEALILNKGKVMNDNLADYLTPNILDMPQRLEVIFVESNEVTGPFGAKGLGQTGTLTVAPALANAVMDAINVRLTNLPITSEKIWENLQRKS